MPSALPYGLAERSASETPHDSCDVHPQVVAAFVRSEALSEPGLAARAYTTLGLEERAAYQRLSPSATRDRLDYLAAHALKRATLAKVSGTSAADFQFRSSRLHCPEILAPQSGRHLRVSVAHADGIALCVVSARAAVGADIESLRNLPSSVDPLDIARTVCSLPELGELWVLQPERRRARLLELWTQKEAVLKATARSCCFPPDSLAIEGNTARRAGTTWNVRMFRLPPHHIAAVALGGDASDAGAVQIEEANL